MVPKKMRKIALWTLLVVMLAGPRLGWAGFVGPVQQECR